MPCRALKMSHAHLHSLALTWMGVPWRHLQPTCVQLLERSECSRVEPCLWTSAGQPRLGSAVFEQNVPQLVDPNHTRAPGRWSSISVPVPRNDPRLRPSSKLTPSWNTLLMSHRGHPQTKQGQQQGIKCCSDFEILSLFSLQKKEKPTDGSTSGAKKVTWHDLAVFGTFLRGFPLMPLAFLGGDGTKRSASST